MKYIFLLLIACCSCSAFKHSLPDQGNFFVTSDGVCKREFVRMQINQDVFASVVRLRYESASDTLIFPKLFRQETANNYRGAIGESIYTVTLGAGQILKIENGKSIIVDYQCH